MPVNTVHKEYAGAIKDVVFTRLAAKGGDKIYDTLPFVKSGNPEADKERHDKLKLRAYYTNFTGRTQHAMVGAVFRKEFKKREIPTAIEYLLENADGEGMSIEQLAKRAVSELEEAGTYGFLAEYSEAPENPSIEDVKSLGLRSSVKSYKVETIINYDTKTINNQEVLSLLVLKETKKDYTDQYQWEEKDQYRVLFLDENNIYTQAVYDESLTLVGDPVQPKQNGSAMNHIPFYFAGTVDNKPGYDKPALYDLAEINYAHLRNVAENEEAMWLTNQPMYHIDIGETPLQYWEEQNPDGVQAGSRKAVVTKGGGLDLVQANPVSNYDSAIERKEQQAVSIGAKLITGVAANQTAETARINASSETSVLNTIVGNVSEALEAAFEDCALFEGANPEEVDIYLNDSFYDETMTYQDVQALVLLRDSEIFTLNMALNKLRASGAFPGDMTNDEIIAELEANPIGMTRRRD